jgi:hypothetical protein
MTAIALFFLVVIYFPVAIRDKFKKLSNTALYVFYEWVVAASNSFTAIE